MAGGPQERGGHGSGDPRPDDGDVDFDGHPPDASTRRSSLYPLDGKDEGRLSETKRRTIWGAYLASGSLGMLRQSLTIWGDLQNRLEIAVTLARFASVLARDGRLEMAARLLSRADALHDEVGFAIEPWIARMNEQTRVDIRTQIDEPIVAQAREQGRALTVDEAVALALDSSG
jgi:hypothetical protein